MKNHEEVRSKNLFTGVFTEWRYSKIRRFSLKTFWFDFDSFEQFKIQLCTVKLLVFSFVRLINSSIPICIIQFGDSKHSPNEWSKLNSNFGHCILKSKKSSLKFFNNFAIYPICRDCRVALVLKIFQFEGCPRNKPAQTWTVGLIKVQTRLSSGVNILYITPYNLYNKP